MRRTTAAVCTAALALAAAGCTNALYFYETGKISLTVEGRPDSSQPVQGSLGFKQRTAVVVPPKREDGSGATGDSGAMLSSFRFGNTSATGIDIRTALVTGRAAGCLSDPQTKSAARVVADAPPIPTYAELAKSSVAAARTGGRLARLQELTARPYDDLTAAEKQELGNTITRVGDGNYNEKLHQAIADELGG